MSYRIFPTEYVWQDGSPVLAIRLRRDGVERYTTPDGQYVVAKGPQLWYWENADDFSINSDAGFRTKREAVASLAEYMLREGLGGFVQRNPKTRAEISASLSEKQAEMARLTDELDRMMQLREMGIKIEDVVGRRPIRDRYVEGKWIFRKDKAQIKMRDGSEHIVPYDLIYGITPKRTS
jgi:hypothetical protein